MKKRNITSRDRQAQVTKERIYNITVQLITKNGFDNVTIEDIAKEAGIARGLFYHYYKSKADIIIETYSAVDADFKKKLDALDENISPVDRIIFLVCEQARYAKMVGVDFVKQVYKAQMDTGTAFFIDKRRPIQKAIHDSIVAGQNSGIMLKEIDPDEYTRLAMSVSRGVLYDWCLHSGDYDIEAAMEIYFRKIIFPEKK